MEKKVMLMVSIRTSDWNRDAHPFTSAPPFENIPPEARGLACSSPLWPKTDAFPNSVVTRNISAPKMSIFKNKMYQSAFVKKLAVTTKWTDNTDFSKSVKINAFPHEINLIV